ncbi:DUF349 domain-containing protein [Massilibacteroides sp.]|uniref:DUF349 domain-containing protein n=1 Tax=Massilibacteroides sp. TaxID=2034766 RepID=UPI0026309DB9|nr:DUF349 domain-containing protein [Massilibacteroides sp.]MDD4513972.1 DUF349 domain-containing protein [Massilibacteroides sp.]
MKDTLETNLPIDDNKLEETTTPEVTPENAVEETIKSNTEAEEPNAEDQSSHAVTGKLSKDEIISKLSELVEHVEDAARNEIDSLKQAFYKIKRSEVENLKNTFIEEGGDEKDFVAPEDETETKIKELLATYKEKRATLVAEEERMKAANHALKLQLIDQLKALTESQDDFNKLYNEFKDIQQRWKEVKAVPQEVANDLWRNYQTYSEKFYDIIKINNQFRDYDFKKNLELKTALCEAVEKLEEEPDVVSAFHQLQKLHQQWREIGPVAREFREEIWGRFKAASTIINKRHQQHFEELKGKEQDNLEAKTAICEEIEAIDYAKLLTFKDWEEKNKEIIALQEKWKTIGFAPKKHNVKIFERFRAACDTYFKNKSEFYKGIKEEMEKNMELKKELCEKVEALKDSQDWKATTDLMIALQKEWKTIGPVARKHSDTIWKRFITACDYFFEQKNKNVSSQRSIEQVNLVAKKEVIEKIGSIDESLSHDEALAKLKEYMGEWSAIGFVPFRDKDKIYKEYHEAVDKQFERLNVDRNDRRMQTFKENISDIAGGERGRGRLYNEREKLMRTYDRMKNELQTYENNMGFLSVSSKGGSGLLKDMERKIEKLKEEMELIVKKIDTIDENLE